VSLPKLQEGGGLKRPAGTIQLEPMNPVALTEIFDRIISWERIKANGDERIVDCPSRIATAYISRVGQWQLPILTGIISAPILRTNGTLLSQPGYDARTGLFLAAEEEWEIPDQPTREDARKALEHLIGPFSEFKFVSSSDRSVLIAAILTGLQRRILEAAPLFGFSAPAQREGKSLLAEAVAILATGRPAPATAVSTQREELRKVVTSILREGHLIVNLDNIEGPFASPDLARAITQAEYGDRILGESRQLRLPTNVLWTATGNNLTLRGDLASRALLCRIDSKLERPEQRTFRITDFKAFLRENRKRLVVDALTILRAYQVAGRPRQSVPAWGGFGDWSASIREPLTWVGFPDPCASRESVIADDPEREEAMALFRAWYRAIPERPVTARDLLKAATKDFGLRDALIAVNKEQTRSGLPNPHGLGCWCRSWRSRVLDGLRLCSDEKRTKSGSRWWVAKAPRVSPGVDSDDGEDVSANRESNSGESGM
jgi:putative DNA primase/helicase